MIVDKDNTPFYITEKRTGFTLKLIQYKNRLQELFPIQSQIRLGGIKFLSFIILDLLCLFVANYIASKAYLYRFNVSYTEHSVILIYAMIVDVFVTLVFNTLNRVLRRGPIRELFECIKHILICFVILSLFLFATKKGADYSRIVVFLSYGINIVFIYLARLAWKQILLFHYVKKVNNTALVMTVDGFVTEAVDALRRKNMQIKGIYLLKNKGIKEIFGIPVAGNIEEAASAICWDQINKVYIYGLDDQTVPDEFIDLCHDMGISVELVDFGYRLIEIKGIHATNPQYGNLNFLEGRRDIPFSIRRVYWITETEAQRHRGFHAHKLNCQLLFCPHGSIDIILDDGNKRDRIRLDDPSKGLILMPGLWREMIWQETGSVLCVLASEYYDADEYIRDYDEFLKNSGQYKETRIG